MELEVLYRDEGSVFLRCNAEQFERFVNEEMKAHRESITVKMGSVVEGIIRSETTHAEVKEETTETDSSTETDSASGSR